MRRRSFQSCFAAHGRENPSVSGSPMTPACWCLRKSGRRVTHLHSALGLSNTHRAVPTSNCRLASPTAAPRLRPASALAGALILSMASVASKTLIDGVLVPVGIVTSLVGIPFFLAIVARTRKASA